MESEGRLIIRRLTVHNFKSFAGTVIIGDFDRKFSCIIGPNGSGKSNVIDAILFVFGIAAKKLRQSKVTDLIHRSTKFPECQSCEVEIVFEKVMESETSEDGFESIPNTLQVLKRVVEKNNQATSYFLNNQRVQKNEVVKKVGELGVDLEHNRFLILQGEVEQISLMKAKGENENQVGFLEYLEDVIGTQHYIQLIEDQQQRLEDATEQRLNLVSRLKMAETQRENLSAAHAAAKHYNELEVQQLDCKYQISIIKIHFHSRSQEISIEQFNDFKQQYKQIRGADKESLTAVNAIKLQLNKTSKQLGKMKDQKERLDQVFQELECQDCKIQNQQKHQRSQITKTENQLKKLQEEIDSFPDEQTILQNNNQYQQSLEQLNLQKNSSKERLQQLRDAVQPEIEELRGRLADLQTHLAPAKTNIRQLQTEREQLQKEVENLLKEKQDAEQQFQTCTDELQTATQEQQQLSQQTQQLQEQMNVYATQQQQQQGTQHQLQHQENQLANQIDQLRGKIREAQQDSSQHVVVQSIMQAVRRGELKGIYGRLESLGTIDDKFDVAISVAAGSQLEWIISDSLRDSQEAIEFVKRRELGVVQIQSLNGLQPPPNGPQQGLPNGICRLYDLVQVREDKFAPAFWKALGNTLVADNIDIAYNYRKQNPECPKIVTLKGEISQFGVMVGGGPIPKGGKMKAQLSFNPEEIQRAEQRIQQLEQELQHCRQQADNYLQQANTQQQESININTQLQTNQTGLQNLDVRIGELQQEYERLNNLIARLNQSEQNVNQNNQNKCQQIDGNIQRIEQESAQLLQQEEQLKNQLENAGGPEVPGIRQQIQQLTEQINQLESNIRKGESELNQMKKMQQQKQQSFQKLSKQLEKSHAKITKLEKEKQQLEEQAIEVETERQELTQKLTEIEAAEAETRAQYDELKSEQENNRKQLMEAERKMKDMEIVVNKENKNLQIWQKKYEKIKQQLQQKGYACEDNEYTLTQQQENEKLMELNARIVQVEEDMKTVKPNQSAIDQYERIDREYKERREQVEKIIADREQIRREFERLRAERTTKFMQGLEIINNKLGEIYGMVTFGGGAAMLELVDNSDPFGAGVNFSVRPPGKAWRNINFLSGGEKTLSSLAFIFALHHYKPSPFYIMDEIDAALDARNVSIVGQLIQFINKDAQFVVVSLKNTMFELAPTLVGICKREDCARCLTIQPRHFTDNPDVTENNQQMDIEE